MRGKIVVCALISTMLTVFPLALAGIGMHANPNPKTYLLLVIDFDDFMCPMCMASVLDFCRALPVSLQKKQVWGVMVCARADSESQEDISDKILKKKIRGFMKANHLKFPILFDQDGIFAALVADGTAVFVFDAGKQAISRYIFPLASNEIRSIQKSLVETIFWD